MANVIKHKRGSGSDPSASNLVVGELAIRTDNGKLFTKMDSGAIAEIAGGGSDIAINTLSSSSATGGGSATFNGSAYRFTLSSPPSVSAAQLLVSVNGVIQKPVAGTGQPSEGFSVDGNDIIFGDAPATGADFFILTFRSLGVSEPADNSVTSAKIVDGTIVNADINASAAIDVSKLSGVLPLAGGTLIGNLSITREQPVVLFNDSTDNPDYYIGNIDGAFRIQDTTNAVTRFQVNTDGDVDIAGKLLLGTTTEGHVNADDLTIAGSGDTGMTIRSGTSSAGQIFFSDATSGQAEFAGFIQYLHNQNSLNFGTDETTRMTINNTGNVGIGTTSLVGNAANIYLTVNGSTLGGIALKANGTNQGYLQGTNSLIRLSSDGAKPIVFDTNGLERMRINSSGKVNIGDTQMSSNLLNVEDGTAAAINIASHGSGGDTAYIGVKKSTGGGLTFGIENRDIIFKTGATYSNGTTFDSGTERLRITSTGDATFSRNLILEGGSNHAYPYIELHSSATSVRKWRIFNGQSWNPDALLIYDIDEDNTTLTIETNKLGINRGANSLTKTLEVGGDAKIMGFLNVTTGIHIPDGGDNDNSITMGSSNDFRLYHDGSNSYIKNNTGMLRLHGTQIQFKDEDNNETMCVMHPQGAVELYYDNSKKLKTITEGIKVTELQIAPSGTETSSLMNFGGGGLTTNSNSYGHFYDRSTGGTNTTAVMFRSAGSQVGKIIFNNSQTFYQSGTSDRTLKKNFENWTETILTSFKNLNPQKFNYIQEEDTDSKHKGFVAQDLAEKFPEAYPKDPETDKYGFNPSGMVVYLMKAVQELTAKVEALEAK